jgi:hypothetical protein
MRKLFWVVCLATVLLPAEAYAWGVPPYEIDAGVNCWFNIRRLDAQAQAAPWYTYWPHEAHFQLPAPITSPYPSWPQPWPPAAGNGAFDPHELGGQQPGLVPPGVQPPGLQPPGVQPPGLQPPGAGNPAAPGALPNLNSTTSFYPFQQAPASAPAAYPPVSYGPQPTGYYYYQPPSYWYGR